jgi:UDP-2,4-diacetamido-2,4,6-trideoxy-beta-L-altropyranose hydrolase
VDVVLGAACEGQLDLTPLSCPVELHRAVDNMAELMSRADLAVGGGGISCWERCAVGLPAVVVTMAENQVPSTEELQHRGAIVVVGDAMSVLRGNRTVRDCPDTR